MLRERRVDTSRFRHARPTLPEDDIRAAVTSADSYADVMRALGLEVVYANHRRVRRKVAELGLDTSHFTRRRPPGTGVPYPCVSCGNPGEWLGRPITLHIDHIDGNWLDNRAGNLRYLCPNCHALTATWCRKKSRDGGGGSPVH